MSTIIDTGSVFGRGLAFPLHVGADGRLQFSQGADNIRESIRIILLTNAGERVMLPEFGGSLGRFLFEPNIAATHRAIEEAIVRSLGRWEPRIAVASVEVDVAPDDAQAAVVSLRYSLVATRANEQMHLRVPVGAGV
jgi:phage baseplate assembly protein W